MHVKAWVLSHIDLYPYLKQADGIDLATCIHTPQCTAVGLVHCDSVAHKPLRVQLDTVGVLTTYSVAPA